MIILDTNVVSELRKIRSGRAEPAVARWASAQSASELYVSVITIQELEIGVLRAERRDASRGDLLRTWMVQHVLPAFAGRILPVDAAVAIRAASLHVPDPKSSNDAFIAATALVHRMALATRNVADFEGLGVDLVNPWLQPD